MPINRYYKTFFVHIPKCAGTSIEKIMDMSTLNDYFSYGRIKNSIIHVPSEKFNGDEYLNCVNKCPQHMTYDEMCKVIDGVDKFFKFSVVRNPYSRLVSEYEYYKSLIKIASVSEKARSSRSIICTHADTFANLINCLDYEKAKRIELFDGHLETQTSYLKNFCGKIYRFENIDEVMNDLKKYSPVTIVPHSRKRESDKPYMEYYTPELLEKVKKFYIEDFTNFNYDI